jgi:sRNA-binding regulator protein Hfq
MIRDFKKYYKINHRCIIIKIIKNKKYKNIFLFLSTQIKIKIKIKISYFVILPSNKKNEMLFKL